MKVKRPTPLGFAAAVALLLAWGTVGALVALTILVAEAGR